MRMPKGYHEVDLETQYGLDKIEEYVLSEEGSLILLATEALILRDWVKK